MEPILQIRNVHISFLYGEKKIPVLKNISFHIDNEIFAVMGETGCGKSVLAASILGLLPAHARMSGSILYKGTGISNLKEQAYNAVRGKEIGLVLQSSANSLNPLLKIKKQLLIPLQAHRLFKRQREAMPYCETLLSSVSLPHDVMNKYPFQLSGGMQHRLMTVLGLACKPSMLILDEPTRGMDMIMRNEYASLINALHQEEKIAILLITHDLELAEKLSHRCVLIHEGEITEYGLTEEIFKNHRSLYFQSLLAALPKNLTRRKQDD